MKIDKIIQQMTTEEKTMIITGAQPSSTCAMEQYGIPAINMSDGPHGVRRMKGKPCHIAGGPTCFPTASAMGATWNRELIYQAGRGMGRDFAEENIQMVLGPGVNMKRTPKCGRNFEYYSEDPYLSGVLAAEFINGIQSCGVGTSLKHYAVNNQELYRDWVNSEVDERTLREYYLKVFEIVLRYSDPTSVMCSYNKLNGIWTSENKYLLTELLKEEWGYDGLVISDWGAVHDICKAVRAGLDLEMPPNKQITAQIQQGLERGIICEEDLNRAVTAVLRWIDRVSSMKKTDEIYSRKQQHQLAYTVATEAITLLKNEGEILPITREKYQKVAVYGYLAEDVLFQGLGSSAVPVEKESVDQPIDCIRNNAEGIQIDYYPILKNGDMGDIGIVEAYDCVVCFVGDHQYVDRESEGLDRDNLRYPNLVNERIRWIALNARNFVLVNITGSAVLPYRWEHIPAIIQMWYCGEGAGKAIADVLFGRVNPSGKLSETFPKQERKGLDYPGDGVKTCYAEGLYVGYRYYDKHPEEVWFPFGHGCSYTKFQYSDMEISQKNIGQECFEIEVSCKIKNIGGCSGKETVQLYLAQKDPVVARPVKELAGFVKILLEPGEERRVTICLSEKEFSYYNTCLHSWHVESGTYVLMLAASSADIRLRDEVSIRYDDDYTKTSLGGAMIL